jgi:hypothetical protein
MPLVPPGIASDRRARGRQRAAQAITLVFRTMNLALLRHPCIRAGVDEDI